MSSKVADRQEKNEEKDCRIPRGREGERERVRDRDSGSSRHRVLLSHFPAGSFSEIPNGFGSYTAPSR